MLFLLVLLALDFVYLYSTRKFTAGMIRRIQGSDAIVRFPSAIFTYACIAAVLYVFILREKRTPLEAFVLGFTTYGIYEGTNYTFFKDWSLSLVVMDTLWGGILFALTTWITQNSMKFLKGTR